MKPKNMRSKKFFMTFLNAIHIFSAVVIIACCVIHTKERKSHPDEPSTVSRGVISFFITLALFLILTAVLGCVGALRLHVRTLYVHACFLIFLASVQVIVGIGAAILSTWVGGGNDFRVQFYKNSTMEDENFKQQMYWDNLQVTYECCGVDGPQDYGIIYRPIPASCCSRAHPLRDGGAKRHLHAACLAEKTYYTIGCENAVGKIYSRARNATIAFAVLLTLMEIIVTVLALCMARTIRRERRKLQQNLQAHFES